MSYRTKFIGTVKSEEGTQEFSFEAGPSPTFEVGQSICLRSGPPETQKSWKVVDHSWVLNSDSGWIQEVYLEGKN